jgi:hypothetical protein
MASEAKPSSVSAMIGLVSSRFFASSSEFDLHAVRLAPGAGWLRFARHDGGPILHDRATL